MLVFLRLLLSPYYPNQHWVFHFHSNTFHSWLLDWGSFITTISYWYCVQWRIREVCKRRTYCLESWTPWVLCCKFSGSAHVAMRWALPDRDRSIVLYCVCFWRHFRLHGNLTSQTVFYFFLCVCIHYLWQEFINQWGHYQGNANLIFKAYSSKHFYIPILVSR